jgi:sugar lactone lactonase YvrE
MSPIARLAPHVKGLAFPESPRWHDDRLWFSDFYERRVSRVDGNGRVEPVVDVPGQPSGLGWLPDGRLLVVSMTDRRLLRLDGGVLTQVADLSPFAAGPCNDMLVDGQGRAYVGNFGFDLMAGAPVSPTHLLRVDPDGTVTRVAEDLWFPNGTVITDDGVLLVDETFGNRVSAFDIAADGSLVNPRVWASFGPLPSETDLAAVLPQLVVAPDGCCLDAEGALWIADGSHGRVVRVRAGGDIVQEIAPGTGTFACMLGGSDGRTLFICAAPDFDEHARSAAREGQLLAVRVEVPRAGRP